MDHFQQFRQTVRRYVILLVFLENILLLGICFVAARETELSPVLVLGGSLILATLSTLAIAQLIGDHLLAPMQAIWRAVLHLSPSGETEPAPKIDELKIGRELVTSLTSQIYQFIQGTQKTEEELKKQSKDLNQNFVAQNLPLPLFVLDASETITFANSLAAQYIGMPVEDLIGKNIYMVLDMSFPSEDTFDKWLKGVKVNSATATSSWERVKLNVRDNHPTLLFDLAAYYNRDNPDHSETILTLFDHTKQYSQDDQAISFIALSVHELRTPLTLLRGYIEVFQDEFSGKVDEELQGFMFKMRSQADQLMAFVNNILNVARVDDDQLELQLQEQNWSDIVKSAVNSVGLRAKVRGITIECKLATDLPSVGVDRISIMEVINNIIDNAIKYSGNSKLIKLETHLTQAGMVETTIQDFGLGIPTSIMPNLFTKFYRDHRNRAQIGGTGLGLYLSKAIVSAHGGNLWVRSKEGEGSTFGFTLVPYAQLAEEKKKSGNKEIVRGAHGWIKNHSLYRR